MNTDYEALGIAPSFSRTLADQVADHLRRAILDGRLRPGQHIIEHELADAVQMSRGPVRDALRILENEGLIVRFPHRGSFVAWLTLEDAEEIYSLREALEGLAAEYAAKRATDEQIAELDSIVARMASLCDECDQIQATDMDLEFHHALCRISGHTRVLSAWMGLFAQVRLLILTHRISRPADFRERAVDWHSQLVGALRQRDGRAAREALRAHLAASFDSTVEAIKLSPAADDGKAHP